MVSGLYFASIYNTLRLDARRVEVHTSAENGSEGYFQDEQQNICRSSTVYANQYSSSQTFSVCLLQAVIPSGWNLICKTLSTSSMERAFFSVSLHSWHRKLPTIYCRDPS